MSAREFFVSSPGRLSCLTGTFAFAAPGILAIGGPAAGTLNVASCILTATIVGCIASAVLSVEKFPLISLAYGLLMPFAAFFYVALLFAAPSLGGLVGGLLIAAGLLPLATLIAAPLRSSGAAAAGRAPASPTHTTT